ncbi:MAG: formate dehydrogenase formation-like protein, partial [Candidatus Solibacter sp.]|nr:formate dehydrogenase formation-like protein [Candidatus Solibacter sp.]
MNGFSWDNRIRRAELLANEYPASAEILRFYGQVARFQQGVYERLKSRIPEALLPSCLERDYLPLLRLVQRIGPARLAEKASDLERNQPAFGELLAAGTSDDLLFFTRVLLQPFMEYTVRRSEEESQDHSARCPACGEWPLAAVLRGEGDGAKRWLICALCSREWEFRRIVCVFCGE